MPLRPSTRDYPFRWMLFQPLWSPSGKPTAAALLIRDAPWLESDRKIAARLAEAFGHARALLDASGRPPRSRPRARLWVAAAAIVLAAGALHVPISVLAPLEVVPRSADVIAMPVEGIVHKVLVEPNAAVSAGTVLVQLVDTTARNKAAVAEQEAAVAAARVEKATSLAFTDPRGRQELGVARAELALKLAERTYARDLLAQTSIKAERAGIAVFSDRRDLEGKPLGVGERLMLVARESAAELKISLPVADSIVLRPGLRVKAFLDSAPLAVAEAHIAHVDIQARLDEMRNATYVVTARLDDPNVHPALGARGTAQIVGDRAPLALYLLRRPLVALRQRFGL